MSLFFLTSGHTPVAVAAGVVVVVVVKVEEVVPGGLPGEDHRVGVRLVVGLEVEHLVHVLRVRPDQPLSTGLAKDQPRLKTRCDFLILI